MTRRRIPRTLACSLLAAAAAGALAGCMPKKLEPPPPETAMPLAEYRLGRSDRLAVKFFYTPELNEEVVIRPDGNISLQLVGDVAAAGRTPGEVAKDLRRLYEPFVQVRDVAVIVREPASAKAYVGGEVYQPTMLPIDGATSLVDAIIMAGGARDTAQLASVILLRPGEPKPQAYLVDVNAALRGGQPIPALQPYDVVYVPKSAVAEVGKFVDLYINRIIPRNATFSAFYNINPELAVTE
jgi:protein involved in polysaccharide export with SLBB domain